MDGHKTLLDIEKYSSGMSLGKTVLLKSINFRKSRNWETNEEKHLEAKRKNMTAANQARCEAERKIFYGSEK